MVMDLVYLGMQAGEYQANPDSRHKKGLALAAAP